MALISHLSYFCLFSLCFNTFFGSFSFRPHFPQISKYHSKLEWSKFWSFEDITVCSKTDRIAQLFICMNIATFSKLGTDISEFFYFKNLRCWLDMQILENCAMQDGILLLLSSGDFFFFAIKVFSFSQPVCSYFRCPEQNKEMSFV